MVAEQVRMGLMTAEDARNHPESSVLLRNLGHELIVSIAKISIPLLQGDRVILCSDGLYNVLRDREIERLTRNLSAATACRKLIDLAHQRRTADDLTCAFFRMTTETAYQPSVRGWHMRLLRLFAKKP
jgi:protein phosphatase